jgi:hypothetical protein
MPLSYPVLQALKDFREAIKDLEAAPIGVRSMCK